MEHIAPPGIGACLVWVKMPERIGKPVIQKPLKTASFLIRKSGVAAVCRRILQIDFLMGYIEITADNDGLFFIQ